MVINSPSVLFVNIKEGNEQKVNSTVRKLTEDYLKAIYIDRLQLDDGEMVLSNRLKMRQDILWEGKFRAGELYVG